MSIFSYHGLFFRDDLQKTMDVSEKNWRMRSPLLIVTLWLFQIAMETGSLIDEKMDDLHIKDGDFP